MANEVAVQPGGYAATVTWTAVAAAIGGGDVMGLVPVQEVVFLDRLGNRPPVGSVLRILSTKFFVDAAAVISGETSYRGHFYSKSPPSAYADNAVWDLLVGDRDSYLDYLDFGTPVDIGGTLLVKTSDQNTDLKLTGNSAFAYLVTNGGFTAAATTRRALIIAIVI
jgi:hypothetical protein